MAESLSLLVIGQALLVRLIYSVSSIVVTYLVYNFTNETRIFYLNLLLIPFTIETIVTLKYKKNAEWTWFLPSVFMYLLWTVPSIIVMEIYSLNFRLHVVTDRELTMCPIVFYDECRGMEAGTGGYYGLNITDGVLSPESHDQTRRYSMLIQQVMMLIIIAGRWLAPTGKLTRDQLSSLLLAITAMAVDMLEFSTDSLSIPAAACDNVYVGFIITAWCWSLMQFPLGLTAVKQRKPRVAGRVVSSDTGDVEAAAGDDETDARDWKSYLCCCCESEIWALAVSMVMQDGPYLVLRLYIIFSAGYFGETLIFFAAKNAIIVALQLYRIGVVLHARWEKAKKVDLKEVADDGGATNESGGDGDSGITNRGYGSQDEEENRDSFVVGVVEGGSEPGHEEDGTNDRETNDIEPAEIAENPEEIVEITEEIVENNTDER